TRLLICTAVEDESAVEATSQAIVEWAENHQAPDGTEDADNIEPLTDKQPATNAKESIAPPLPQELLLSMAAVRMPKSAVDDATVVRMLTQVMAIARAADQPALINGLKCE